MAKKRLELELGLAEEIHPEVNENFPSSGFECGTHNLPRISYTNIWKYLIDEVELKKQLATKSLLLRDITFISLVMSCRFFQQRNIINIMS